MKNIQFGLMVLGMLAIGQLNAQKEENGTRPRPTTTTKPPAVATPTPGTKVDKKFAKLDANGDGYLVLAEMQKGKGEEAKDQENRFRKMDVNKDNRVTPEEFRAHKAKKEKKGKKDGDDDDRDEREEKEVKETKGKPVNKGGKK